MRDLSGSPLWKRNLHLVGDNGGPDDGLAGAGEMGQEEALRFQRCISRSA